jgi:hypothetical protein
MARRAVEVQFASLRDVEQTTPHQQIVARSVLAAAEGVLEQGLVDRTKGRDRANRATNLLQQRGRIP